MKLSGLTKMVKRQLVCNVFHNDESDDFYIGTASAIYCATGFPRPLNRNQMGAMLGISEDTMIEKVVYNDFDCAYKIDFQGFNLDDTIKDEVEVKKLGIGIYCSGEILIPLVTEIATWSALSVSRTLRRWRMKLRITVLSAITRENKPTERFIMS